MGNQQQDFTRNASRSSASVSATSHRLSQPNHHSVYFFPRFWESLPESSLLALTHCVPARNYYEVADTCIISLQLKRTHKEAAVHKIHATHSTKNMRCVTLHCSPVASNIFFLSNAA